MPLNQLTTRKGKVCHSLQINKTYRKRHLEQANRWKKLLHSNLWCCVAKEFVFPSLFDVYLRWNTPCIISVLILFPRCGFSQRCHWSRRKLNKRVLIIPWLGVLLSQESHSKTLNTWFHLRDCIAINFLLRANYDI